MASITIKRGNKTIVIKKIEKRTNSGVLFSDQSKIAKMFTTDWKKEKRRNI